MKTKKRTIRESTGDADYFIKTHSMKQVGRHKEFDRRFAGQLADALEQFANRKRMTPDEVMDGGDSLMSEFANWAKKKLGLDIDQNMSGAEEFVEDSGSRVEDVDILDWIYNKIGECEWVEDRNYVDNANAFEVSTPGPDGDVFFKISVTKV